MKSLSGSLDGVFGYLKRIFNNQKIIIKEQKKQTKLLQELNKR